MGGVIEMRLKFMGGRSAFYVTYVPSELCRILGVRINSKHIWLFRSSTKYQRQNTEKDIKAV
jgi:hypothetical protein